MSNDNQDGNPRKAVLIPHIPELTDARFMIFIERLHQDLNQFFERGDWLLSREWKPLMGALVGMCIDRIIMNLSVIYVPEYNALMPEVSTIPAGEMRLVLVTKEDEHFQKTIKPITYPVGVNVASDTAGLNYFYGDYRTAMDRLWHMYGRKNLATAYASTNLDPYIVIKMVLAETFTSMEKGCSIAGFLSPPTRLCAAWRVQDVPIDSRLTMGADIVYVPIVPDGKEISDAICQILGLDDGEEEPPKPSKPSDFKELKRSFLTDQQIISAQALGKGIVQSVYMENGNLYVLLSLDPDHVYEWVQYKDSDGGMWKRIKDTAERWMINGKRK
jgi:hypothetical protein